MAALAVTPFRADDIFVAQHADLDEALAERQLAATARSLGGPHRRARASASAASLTSLRAR
jgi:hypothetical protein